MKVHIDSIESSEIRHEMRLDSYQYADLLGTYHNDDGEARLYRAADTIVLDFNGIAFFKGCEDFRFWCEKFSINLSEVAS